MHAYVSVLANLVSSKHSSCELERERCRERESLSHHGLWQWLSGCQSGGGGSGYGRGADVLTHAAPTNRG